MTADLQRRFLAPILRSRLAQGVLITLIAAAVYLPFLGQRPLHSTEAHRVVPALEMLETGEWRVPQLFEFPYLRKPPGMPWAIALSVSVLGENEFAFRLPSAIGAIAMALAAWWYAARWFGSPFALAAGLTQALAPAWWRHARSAEIDPLLFAATQLAVLALIDLAVKPLPRATPRRTAALGATGLALAVLAAMLLKGPVTLPVLAACLIAIALTLGPPRLTAPPILLGLAAALAASSVSLLALEHAAADRLAVRQGVGEFLFRPSELLEAASLPPQVLAVTLPASLALLFPWGPDARRESRADPAALIAHRAARILAITTLLSLLAYLAFVAHALRYVLPAAVTLAPLTSYAVRGLHTGFTDQRRSIARALMLRYHASWPSILFVAAWANILAFEPSRAQHSGVDAARQLAERIPPGSTIIADSQIDTRPELLLELERVAGARALWRPDLIGTSLAIADPQLPRAGTLLLLRDDELARYHDEALLDQLEEITRTTVGEHDRTIILLRVIARRDTMPSP